MKVSELIAVLAKDGRVLVRMKEAIDNSIIRQSLVR